MDIKYDKFFSLLLPLSHLYPFSFTIPSHIASENRSEDKADTIQQQLICGRKSAVKNAWQRVLNCPQPTDGRLQCVKGQCTFKPWRGSYQPPRV
jgi:hypothetical protein